MHRINDLGYTIQENAPHLSVVPLEKSSFINVKIRFKIKALLHLGKNIEN